MQKPFIESKIDKDGKAYIVIAAQNPNVDKYGLYQGGKMYSFHIDHKNNTTELYDYYYHNGAPHGFDKCLKKWKEETLIAKECFEYCDMLIKRAERKDAE